MNNVTRRQPYPAYKDSGVEWLGQIPMGFTPTKLKRVVSIIDGDRGSEYPNESDFVDDGIPFLSSKNIINNKMSYSNLRFISIEKFGKLGRGKLQQDDLIITVRGTIGSIGHFTSQEFDTAFINAQMMILRPQSEVTSRFLYYIALGEYWLSQLEVNSYGTAQQQLSNEILANLIVVIPPLPEQCAIAAFLDRETPKLDTLLAKKRRLIELLQEKRAALISQAVTKGLNPDIPMKDSGVEWLGEIPGHWEVKRLKFLAEVRTGTAKGRDFGDRDTIDLPYLRVANVQDGYLDLSDVATITVGVNEIERYLLKPGDVLMNEGGDFDKLGRGYVWHGEIPKCVHHHVEQVKELLLKSLSPTGIFSITWRKRAERFLKPFGSGKLPRIFEQILRRSMSFFRSPHAPEIRAAIYFLVGGLRLPFCKFYASRYNV